MESSKIICIAGLLFLALVMMTATPAIANLPNDSLCPNPINEVDGVDEELSEWGNNELDDAETYDVEGYRHSITTIFELEKLEESYSYETETTEDVHTTDGETVQVAITEEMWEDDRYLYRWDSDVLCAWVLVQANYLVASQLTGRRVIDGQVYWNRYTQSDTFYEVHEDDEHEVKTEIEIETDRDAVTMKLLFEMNVFSTTIRTPVGWSPTFRWGWRKRYQYTDAGELCAIETTEYSGPTEFDQISVEQVRPCNGNADEPHPPIEDAPESCS